MKLLLLLSIVAVVCGPIVFANENVRIRAKSGNSQSSSANSCAKINKVKLTDVAVTKVNKNYAVNKLHKADVIKVNETYNRLAIDYEVNKRFPMDTEFAVKVLRSTSPDGHYHQIREYNIPFCKHFESEHFKYLPKKLIKIVKEGKCLTEGLRYQEDDGGYFRFDELLSEEELNDAYFKLITSLKTGREVFFRFELKLESNCKTQ